MGDTRGGLNSLTVRLDSNFYHFKKNKPIQDEWTLYGRDQFEIKVIDTLDYDKDESKTDYSEELELLRTTG